jgi:hypothetical protein
MPTHSTDPKPPRKPPPEEPDQTAEKVAQSYFGIGNDAQAIARGVRRSLIGAVVAAFITPVIFLLRFGEVTALGWGLTVFLIAYCLLSAIGLYFLRRREYHTSVPLKGDWMDRIGAFWLMACAFGPLLGWFITDTIFPVTSAGWRWQYGLKAFLCIWLPVITALPLTRYARGKSALVAIPLLIGITLLPILVGLNPGLDVLAGPVIQRVEIIGTGRNGCRPLKSQPLGIACHAEDWGAPGDVVEITYLRHTGKMISLSRLETPTQDYP